MKTCLFWQKRIQCQVVVNTEGKVARKMKISRDESLAWIAYATKRDEATIETWQMTDRQMEYMGRALKENKLLNPPRSRKRKRIAFICACPCRQAIVTTYTTKKPTYKNKAHKQRALRERGRQRANVEGRPIMCTTCMVRIVINSKSPIESERYTCRICHDGLLL